MLRDYWRTGALTIPAHLQWWAGLFQFSAHVTQIFLVPNHALPGWFFAVVSIMVARRDLDVGYLGATFASLVLWSPLAIISAPLVLIYFAWRDRGAIFSPRIWIGAAAGACFVPVVVYLLIDAATIAHSAMIWEPGFLAIYLLFIAIEIPHAAFVFVLWNRVRPELKGLFAIAVMVLIVLPLYSFGPGNDLVMRGSIAPLFILAFVFASTLLDLDAKAQLMRVVGAALVVIGAGVPIIGIFCVLILPRFSISACNLVTASSQLEPYGLPTNYVAATKRAPGWLLRAPSVTRDFFETIGADPCWPDHPVHNGRPKNDASAGDRK